MMTLEKLRTMHTMLHGEQPEESRMRRLARDVEAAMEGGPGYGQAGRPGFVEDGQGFVEDGPGFAADEPGRVAADEPGRVAMDRAGGVLEAVWAEAERASRALQGIPQATCGPAVAVAADAREGLACFVEACALLERALLEGDAPCLLAAVSLVSDGEALLDAAEDAVRELKERNPLLM